MADTSGMTAERERELRNFAEQREEGGALLELFAEIDRLRAEVETLTAWKEASGIVQAVEYADKLNSALHKEAERGEKLFRELAAAREREGELRKALKKATDKLLDIELGLGYRIPLLDELTKLLAASAPGGEGK